MYVKFSHEDLNSNPCPPHPISTYTYGYLWSDHRTKGAQWSAIKYYTFYPKHLTSRNLQIKIYQFHKTPVWYF